MLTWENSPIQGTTAIMEKLQVSYAIETYSRAALTAVSALFIASSMLLDVHSLSHFTLLVLRTYTFVSYR